MDSISLISFNHSIYISYSDHVNRTRFSHSGQWFGLCPSFPLCSARIEKKFTQILRKEKSYNKSFIPAQDSGRNKLKGLVCANRKSHLNHDTHISPPPTHHHPSSTHTFLENENQRKTSLYSYPKRFPTNKEISSLSKYMRRFSTMEFRF